jgi:hypothetical protein
MAEKISKRFGISRGRARRPRVELAERPAQVYVYEDEVLKIEIPVPPLDVFVAFVRELDKLGGEDADVEKYLTTLARAFWVLHRRPGRRGVLRRRYKLREPSDDEAGAFLVGIFPRVDLVLESLSKALAGFVTYVLGEVGENANG